MSDIRPAPLAGVRVIESSLLGPAAITTHLADLGAEVIKVESPAGDYIREMTWPIINDVSLLHWHINRGKQSLALDLKDPAAKGTLTPLIREADVLVEQFRPGVMDRLGLGYEAVKAITTTIHTRTRPRLTRAKWLVCMTIQLVPAYTSAALSRSPARTNTVSIACLALYFSSRVVGKKSTPRTVLLSE